MGREPGRSCEPTGEAPQSEDHGGAPPLPAASRNGRTFTSVSTGAVRSPQLIKPGGSVSKFFFKMERNHSDNLAIYNRARAGGIANFLRTGSGWVHSFRRPKCKLQSCLVSRNRLEGSDLLGNMSVNPEEENQTIRKKKKFLESNRHFFGIARVHLRGPPCPKSIQFAT